MFRIIPAITIFFLYTVPFTLSAQGNTFGGNDGAGGSLFGGNRGGSESSVSLQNPLKSNSLREFLQSILDAIMVFAVPIIVFFIIYAGFLYVMARGNETKVAQAHKALLYAIIGGLLILGANIILQVIGATVDAFR